MQCTSKCNTYVQQLNVKWLFQCNICHYKHHKVCIVMDEIKKGYLMHVFWVVVFCVKKIAFSCSVLYVQDHISWHKIISHIIYSNHFSCRNIYKIIYSLVRRIVWGSWRKSTIENNGLLRNLEVNQASYYNLQWYHSNSLIFLHIHIYIVMTIHMITNNLFLHIWILFYSISLYVFVTYEVMHSGYFTN